ncbi:MurR/RpiR family transcriptional regulator [Lachnospiraceae bacterium 42-17]|jgi:DNA-binding MurR/RpiR family transcriptional regulator|nr:MurR/RpiR family transcriptional regulator [Dorea sp.]
MFQPQNIILKEIEDIYDNLTPVEKNIADYFLKTKNISDFSAKTIADSLYVSEASLTRFAKKCGYKGFREFIYSLKISTSASADNVNEIVQRVTTSYKHILDKNLQLINETQMETLAFSISKSKRILIYGIGISGIVAQEFKLRLMRLGLLVDAVTDAHLMKISSALVDENHLIIALSISGKTKELLNGIKIAKEHGAYVVLLTASKDYSLLSCCDEIIPVAAPKNFTTGTLISPQFPLLIMLDIFYSYYLQTDYATRFSIYSETLSALNNDEPSGK